LSIALFTFCYCTRPLLTRPFPSRRSSDLSEESHLPGVLGRMFGVFNRGFARATQGYSRTVQRAVRRTSIGVAVFGVLTLAAAWIDRKSTRLNSSHGKIAYAVFCLKKKLNH